jgi:hypothetical protein
VQDGFRKPETGCSSRDLVARIRKRVSLVQLGCGARRQRILTSFTERTGRIAECISVDKDLSKSLLKPHIRRI